MTQALYDHNDTDDIVNTLMGRRVVSVINNLAKLDDGTMLAFAGNEGGCACSSGDYDLTELNTVDNIITKVEFVDSPAGDDMDGKGYYKIFVYADNVKVNLATFEGSDGNGYYGTGYTILVTPPAEACAYPDVHPFTD